MDGLVVYTVELTILNRDVVDSISQLRILITNNHHAIFRFLTGYILHRHITNDGVETTTAYLTRFIIGINLQYSLATLTNPDVADIDVLDDTTSTRVCLDAKHTVQRWRIHFAVFCKDILATTTDFRTDYHTTMTVVKLAVTNNDVL